MKKFVSMLLALMMLMSLFTFTAVAEEDPILESASGFYYIEAEGDRPRLSAADKSIFIQVDGQWYKDLNKNGQLDVYENWAAPVADRVADLLSQMTLKEKTGLLGFGGIAGNNGSVCTDFSNASFNGGTGGGSGDISSVISPTHPCMTATKDEVSVVVGEMTYPSMAYQTQVMGLKTYIAALTGTPKDQLELMNAIQVLNEESRLGIPGVFSGDRSYNTWGGMIDMPHYALGVAGDTELLYKLVSEYSKESVAIGYHQVFHGYGNEIGSWYGDDPNHIAEMAAVETRAYDDWGFNSHSKHFIARGGRNAYVNAKSPADLIDSWKIGWKAVVDAGTQWVMTNNNVGITPGLQAFMDKDTFDILRVELGYEGIVCLDWPLSPTSLMSKTGITSDGIDVSTLTLGERYVLILNAGVDMFSCGFLVAGTDTSGYTGNFDMVFYPDVLAAEIEAGKYAEADLDVHVCRVLKNKFDLGIFENPYRDWDEAAKLIYGDNYVPGIGEEIPMSNDDINALRRPEIKALEEEVMVKSTIVLKNDDILPLAQGIKVYVDANAEATKEADKAAIAAYATVVDTMADADVCVFHVTAFDDNYAYMVEDAQAAGKQFVTIIEATNSSGEPTAAQLMAADAFIQQTYKNTPDHGSSVGSFYRLVTPSVTADMLFGVKEPTGQTLFEVGYEVDAKSLSWGELQDDIGVDDATRLYMAMLAKENPAIEMPNNLGDVLYTDSYGIIYSQPADIELSLLTLPRAATTTVGSNGRASTVVGTATQKAGVAFEINFVAKNNGGDGHITAQVLVDGAVAAEKFVALDGGQFRVITIELTLEAGEHVITLGDMTATVVVE